MSSTWMKCGRSLSRGAGLVHDIGKASLRFRDKLRENLANGDDVRHEWLSVKLLQALRANGWDWHRAWAKGLQMGLDDVTLGKRTVNTNSPHGVSDGLEAIDLLVVTHHGLLTCQASEAKVGSAARPMCPTAGRDEAGHLRRTPSKDHLQPAGDIAPEIFAAYRQAEAELLTDSEEWSGDLVFWRALSLVCRAALICADHSVSRKVLVKADGAFPAGCLYANTAMVDGTRRLNQPLDWHLTNVGAKAESVFGHMAAWFDDGVAAEPLPGLGIAARARLTAAAGADQKFQWQDTAGDALTQARAKHPDLPFLLFNMAGTGTGKTRMNLRAACTLARDVNPRVSVALNLRSLTLQTGLALRRSAGLSENELAVVIGDALALDLFESNRDEEDEDGNCHEVDVAVEGGIGSDLPDWLTDALPQDQDRRLMAAPLLVSTVDFLAAAGDPSAQGRHVKALFRCCSADLVLDEIDSYEPEALVAVLRIVQMAALAGRNVIASSATLSQVVAEALHEAFRSGIALREALHQRSVGFVCAAIDNHVGASSVLVTETARTRGAKDFSAWYKRRTDALVNALRAAPVERLAAMLPVESITLEGWRSAVLAGCKRLHEAYRWRFGEGRSMSIGLVRVANIATAIQTARFLAQQLPEARICCYHSAEFPIARFEKEARLDHLLSRAAGNDHIRSDAEICALFDLSSNADIPFIVVATPVEEIGRDHDFDWAVIDPSSMQSIIQCAGRVHRHRRRLIDGVPNILILQFNWRHCQFRGDLKQRAFCWPGYEEPARNFGNRSSAYGNRDIGGLLPWSNGRLLITAALRFDAACTFSVADDASVRKRVVGYFGVDGQQSNSRPHSWLLTQGDSSPYRCAPLRSTSGKDEYLRVQGTDANPDYQQAMFYLRDGSHHKHQDDTVNGRSVRTRQALKNAWLGFGVEAMFRACSRRGINADLGMAACLTRYARSDSFEHDLGFGVMRVPTTAGQAA